MYLSQHEDYNWGDSSWSVLKSKGGSQYTCGFRDGGTSNQWHILIEGYGYVCMGAQSLSHVWLFATLWSVAHSTVCSPQYSLNSSDQGILQARILEWLPFPPPGVFLNPGIKPVSPESLCIGRKIIYHWATCELLLLSLRNRHNGFSAFLSIERF